jgi:cyclopropane fatty-acyl-phospholipid synthase-like methyltransferase
MIARKKKKQNNHFESSMKVSKRLYKKLEGPLYVFVFTLAVQVIVTFIFTKTKRFSIRATVRNLSITFALYYAIKTGNYFLLAIPVILEIVIEVMNYSGYNMDPYVATEYLYSDFLDDRVKKNPLVSNYSEANFDGIMGFKTTDNSPENNKRMYEWCKYAYLSSINKPGAVLRDLNDNVVPEPKELKKIIDERKFELFAKKCGIKQGMRILEIGFGEGDFMDYVYKHYNVRVVGVSISDEQVKTVKKRGFEAYHMNSWDMTPEKIGTFDLIYQLGNLEYNLRSGQDPEIQYTKYSRIIQHLLNPSGKYFITCCHVNDRFNKGSIVWRDYSLDYCLHIYALWSGNDGFYPRGKDGFSKYANSVGLRTVYQEERTHDYALAMTLLLSYISCYDGSCVFSYSNSAFADALFKTIAAPYYIHSFFSYLSTEHFIWNPFMWEFIPQELNGEWEPPVTLQYILFQNEKI